ncbi:1266_t:CDS:1, partial [Racocetra persica]
LDKVLAISKIRNDILYSCKIKNTKKYDNRIRYLHIATPILSDDEPVEEELTITDLNYQVNNNKNKDNVKDAATKFSNVEKADTRPSNVEKAAIGISNIEKAATKSSNIEKAATRFSNWTNQNFENKNLVTEEEQQWKNTINK